MSRKRLTFEALRDGVLAAAGRLDADVGGRSVDLFKAPFATRRAVYGFIDRQNLPGTFRSFDLALPDTHAPQRFATTVPQQALFLMNAPFVIEQAKALAARAIDPDPAKRIGELYRLAYCRRPTAEEIDLALAFVTEPPPMGQVVAVGAVGPGAAVEQRVRVRGLNPAWIVDDAVPEMRHANVRDREQAVDRRRIPAPTGTSRWVCEELVRGRWSHAAARISSWSSRVASRVI